MRSTTVTVSIVALVIASALLLTQLHRKSEECERQAERIETLYRQAKMLEQFAATSKQRADSVSRSVEGMTLSPIHGLFVDRFRELGLADPVSDLIGDLQSHPEIIPYPGLHGSRMGFYDVNRIRVLSESWVYAPFEDGHIGGEALFEYEVARGGAISWRVLESRLQQ